MPGAQLTGLPSVTQLAHNYSKMRLLFPFVSCLFVVAFAEQPRPVPPYQWMKDRLQGHSGCPRGNGLGIMGDQIRLTDPPNIVMPPPSGGDDDRNAPDASSGLTISDVISSERHIGIFSGFTRDIGSVSKRLEDGGQNSTILAPDNTYVTKLPRKPWEDPKDYEELGTNAYAGDEGEDRAHRNLRRFVEAHIVPESPWPEGKKTQTLVGSTVWWESKEGKKFVS